MTEAVNLALKLAQFHDLWQPRTVARMNEYDIMLVKVRGEFYPRFGFARGSARGLRCERPVPDEAFMVIELRWGALADGGGVVEYPPEFSA